jgi:hypothetical protein
LNMRVLWTLFLGWLWIAILLISASQVARITGVSHWHPAQQHFELEKTLGRGWRVRSLGWKLFLGWTWAQQLPVSWDRRKPGGQGRGGSGSLELCLLTYLFILSMDTSCSLIMRAWCFGVVWFLFFSSLIKKQSPYFSDCPGKGTCASKMASKEL